jgi:hypothetical protein
MLIAGSLTPLEVKPGGRPGFAFAPKDQAAQDAKARAYADYDYDVQKGWRSPRQHGGPNVSEDRPGYTTARDGPLLQVADNGPKPRTESRFEAMNVDAVRNHSRVMEPIYDLRCQNNGKMEAQMNEHLTNVHHLSSVSRVP